MSATSAICQSRNDRGRWCWEDKGHVGDHRTLSGHWWPAAPLTDPPDPSTWFANFLAYPKANT